jgi:hypothetical protein
MGDWLMSQNQRQIDASDQIEKLIALADRFSAPDFTGPKNIIEGWEYSEYSKASRLSKRRCPVCKWPCRAYRKTCPYCQSEQGTTTADFFRGMSDHDF